MMVASNLDIREDIGSASYFSTVYKAQVYLMQPVLHNLDRRARFDRPEDMIQTCGNLLANFLEFGGSSLNISLDDIKTNLKEDFQKSSDSVFLVSKMQTIHKSVAIF